MSDSEHPAATLVSAIERLQVLLRSLNTFYDQPRDAFALQPNFMMLSLGVAETCAAQAQEALASIMQHCDLTLLPAVVEPPTGLSSENLGVETDQSQRALFESLVDDAAETTTDDVDLEADEAEPTMVFEPRKEMPRAKEVMKSGPSEQFAQTYLELLQKLTAAEIFATEQQALSPIQAQQQPLLPLLRSLRQDIQKLHNVA